MIYDRTQIAAANGDGMKPSGEDTNRRGKTLEAAAGAITLCLFCVATVRGQTPSAPRAPMAEEVFKNIQVFKGIPVDQFMGTMGIFAVSLAEKTGIPLATRFGGFHGKQARRRRSDGRFRVRCSVVGPRWGCLH